MRKPLLGIVFGIFALLLAVAVIADEPPETVTLDDCMDKKAAVEFPHAAHKEVAECVTCHHTQADLTADSVGGMDVQPCSECHVSPEGADTPVCSEMSLKKNPYHITCIGCHKEQGAGPAKCDECHPKAEG